MWLDFFDHHGSAICENFGDALHDFVGVVAEGDDRVGSELSGMKRHHGVGVLAGFFAELGEKSDVATNESLQASADRGEDVARADDDAADDTEIANDAMTRDFKGSCDEGWVEGQGWRWVGGHACWLLCYRNSTRWDGLRFPKGRELRIGIRE